MKTYRADFHIHSVLSPCGDLDMSPVKIIKAAVEKKLDIIGISDHNTTRHCSLMKELGREHGIFVLTGSEVTTKEEVHCLVFFEDYEDVLSLQDYMDTNLPNIRNDPEKFGYQVQVDVNEMIVYEEEKSLFGAVEKSIDELEEFVHSLGGIFIPAHIDRYKNSIFSQLGFMPPDLKADALEISKKTKVEDFRKLHPELERFRMITSSDAHYLQDIGTSTTLFEMENLSFAEIKMALSGINGRKIRV